MGTYPLEAWLGYNRGRVFLSPTAKASGREPDWTLVIRGEDVTLEMNPDQENAWVVNVLESPPNVQEYIMSQLRNGTR